MLTLGADPELFLTNVNGKFISSIGKFGGSKSDPRPLHAHGCKVQEDNVALEFNIPPASTEEEFVGSITAALAELKQLAFIQDLNLAIKASAIFDVDQLDSPQARAFGCTPDYDAWSGKANKPPRARTNLRSCGGHIHFGYPSETVPVRQFVRANDVFIGAPLSQLDGDRNRRDLYGKAGAFRYCNYGHEYRTPSNYWLQSEDLMRRVYNAAHRSYHYCLRNPSETFRDYKEVILAAVNHGDKSAYDVLVRHYGIVF